MHALISLAFAFNPAASDYIEREVVGTGDILHLAMPEGQEYDTHVVGGQQAEAGEWDDAVGIVFENAYVGCTGTLVAPKVVITAAHCTGAITHVIVGTKNWISNQGEAIEVRNTYVHQSYTGGGGYDFAVLKLRDDSTYPPRTIATDCVLEEDLYDGAPVTIAGFGNTRADGGGSTSQLLWVDSVVRDADCSRDRIDGIFTGCLPALRPGGEIAAGGRLDYDGDGDVENADACFGDSGGPLYLHSERGTFVVGVTSRSFIGVDPAFPCRDGGIWVRPDALMNFIENRTGEEIPRPQCNEAPIASATPIVTRPGGFGNSFVDVEDPDGDAYFVEVLEQPTLGELTAEGGDLTFVAYEGVEGTETVMVTVTDDGHPVYEGSPPITIEVPVDITVRRGLGGQCGCTSGVGPIAPAGILLGLLGLVWRRRS